MFSLIISSLLVLIKVKAEGRPYVLRNKWKNKHFENFCVINIRIINIINN